MMPLLEDLTEFINPTLFMLAVISAFMIHKAIWLCIMFVALLIFCIEYLYQSIKAEMDYLRTQHHHSFYVDDDLYDGDTDGSDDEENKKDI